MWLVIMAAARDFILSIDATLFMFDPEIVLITQRLRQSDQWWCLDLLSLIVYLLLGQKKG